MKITIKYFSWIRVKLKKGSEEFDFEQNTTFKMASNILREKHPIFEEVFNDSFASWQLGEFDYIDSLSLIHI